jgi:hypothetical protein
MLCKPKESWDLLIPKSFMLVFFHTSGQTLLCRPCFVMPIFGLMVSQSGSSAWVSSLWSHHPVFLFFFKGKLLRCYTHTHMFHTFLGMIGLLGLASVRLVWASLRCQDRRCSVVFPRRTEDLCSVGKRWATHDRHGRHDRHDAILFCTSRGVGCPLSL